MLYKGIKVLYLYNNFLNLFFFKQEFYKKEVSLLENVNDEHLYFQIKQLLWNEYVACAHIFSQRVHILSWNFFDFINKNNWPQLLTKVLCDLQNLLNFKTIILYIMCKGCKFKKFDTIVRNLLKLFIVYVYYNNHTNCLKYENSE